MPNPWLKSIKSLNPRTSLSITTILIRNDPCSPHLPYMPLSPHSHLHCLAHIHSWQDHHPWKEPSLGSSRSILTPPLGERYKASHEATVLNMPSDNHLPNIPIPLLLTHYVIPLAFMVEYLAQQLWALICQSLEETGNLSPLSSPSLSPQNSSPEDNHLIGSYETLLSSPTHVLPVRLRSTTYIEENPSGTLPIIPRNPSGPPPHPTLLWCLLCWSLEHELQTCPQYKCPICLHPTPGHGNNSCPNSPVDPDSSDEDWLDDLWVIWFSVSRAETGVMLQYWWTPILFLPAHDPQAHLEETSMISH